MSEGLGVVRPLSSKPLYMRMRESLVYWIYTLKRLYIIYFVLKKQILPPFQSIEPFESAYPDALSVIEWFVGFESPVVGRGTVQDFWLLYRTTGGPFYLTVDKTARLALMKPLTVGSSLPSPSAVQSHRAIKKRRTGTRGCSSGSSSQKGGVFLYVVSVSQPLIRRQRYCD